MREKTILLISIMVLLFIMGIPFGASLISTSLNVYGEQTNITVDTVFPTVNFSTGSDANGSFLPVPRIKINISSTELNPDRLNVSLKNGTNLAASFNISYNTTPNWNNFNFTGLADDQYNVSAVLTDLAGNRNSTLTNLTITVDTTAATISLISPSHNAFENPTFTLSYFVNDTSGISSCSIESEVLGTINNGTALNISNNNANNQYNESTVKAGSQVVWRVDCTDSAGNTASSETRAFTISQTLPSGTGDGGGGVISIGEPSPVPCKAGQQTYYVNSTRYCVTCNGKIEASKNNPYNVTCVQTTQQKAVAAAAKQISQMTNNQKVFTAIVAATFILLFSNRIVKWKGKVKKKNV